MNKDPMHLGKFLNVVKECDPNGERKYEVRKAIEKDTKCYKTL